MTQRSNADWGALVRAEIDGHELPGTVAKLVAAATGKSAADDGLGAETKGLLRLLELLHNPGNLKKHISDLDRAASAAATATEQARAEQVRAAAAKADLIAEREKHEAAISYEVKNHQAVMAAAAAELAAVRKQAADLKSKSEADAAKAKSAAAEADRRLRILSGAAA